MMNAEHKPAASEALAEDAQDDAPGPSVYWAILGASLLLLLLLPAQAPWIDTQRGWFTQPAMGSLLGLSVMTVFALVRVVTRYRQWHPGHQLLEELFATISSYRVALLSGVLFFLYINSLALIGFILATVLFVSTLLWLSRLLDRFWFITTLGTVATLVVIFRVGLNLWLPEVWLYEQLPARWADFANQYL